MPPADPAPTAPGDPELTRLLDAYAAACCRYGSHHYTERQMDDARAAVDAHIAARYISRPISHLEYLEKQQDARQP